ncbi:MAG: hypothetical protein QNK05_20570, partial [Myxococcota bacterium]|nr:hypothetical protein [Myxococcota bacterium]
ESARAAGHVSARLAGREAGGGHVTLALRDFWQRFPSELAVDGRSLVARLYTDAGRAGPLDLRPAGIADWIGEPLMAQLGSGRMRAQFAKARGARNLDPSGLARTHRLWLHFAGDGVSESDRVEAARAFELPPVLIADPAWSAGTGALGLVSAVDDARFPERESVVRTAYREVANLIDEWGDYGFLDHGAGPHHAYELDDEGRIRALPWRYSGVDFGFTRATWIAWLRSGERPYHDLASTRTHFNADVLRSHVDAPDRRLGDWRFWASGPTVVPWQSPGKGEPAEREGLAPALGLGGGFGLDVESLLFDYWLSGDLRSLEVAREVASALTRLVTDPEVPIERWAAEAHTNRSRWVFQTMVDLAVLGEQLDDATLSGAARRIAATALDPDAPGGVAHHPAPQGGPRLGHPSYLFYKAPWMLRYAATQTGDEAERTRQALVRGAEYALRTRSREGRTAGLRLGLGTRWSGDARYLAFGIERADVYRDLQNREPQGRRGYTRRLGGVLGNAADLLISQGAVMASLAERKGTLPAVPSLWKDAKRPAAAVLLAKRPGEPLSVELVHGAVRFERPDGSGWPASWLGAPTDYLPEWGTETVRHRRVVIPAGAAPGLYRIRAPWGAELVVLGIEGGETRLEAPEGFHLGGAGKAAWSFRFAPGPKRVFTSASGSVELLDPDGRPVTLRGKRGWTRVRGGDGVYRVRALAPAFFSASALGSRYAHAEASPAPLGGVPTPARLPEEDAPEVRVERGALSLLRKGTLELEADRVRTDAGSIEWWWQPDWDSGVLGKGERKGLVAVAGSVGESQLYYRYSTTSKGVDVFELRFEVNERVPAGSRKARRRQSPWLGRQQPIRWQRGQRLHVALEWWSEGERRHMRLLVDGVPMTGRAGRGESPVWPIPERPRFVRFGPGGSRRGLPFDGTLHAVRVSTAPRYRRAEIGAPPLPDGVDATTSLLCRFADREGACVDAAGRPAFRLSGG